MLRQEIARQVKISTSGVSGSSQQGTEFVNLVNNVPSKRFQGPESLMQQHEIEEVAKVLSDWNPLGVAAERVADLDGYKTEAIDIISVLRVTGGTQPAERVVMQVLNQAFGLSLTPSECSTPATRISAVLGAKH
jgi:hypothetical protein